MSRIALTFPILKFFGGAELTTIKIANYLSKKNKIDLIVCGKNINENIQKLINKDVNIITLESKILTLNYLISKVIIFAQCYIIFFLRDKKYDKIISTSGELPHKNKVYQLIHFPFYSLNILDYFSLGTKFYEFHKIIFRFVAIYLCRVLFNINRHSLSQNITFANSKWSSEKYSSIYNIQKNVFHNYLTFTLKKVPDIKFEDFETKKDNFIVLGRVTKDKKIHDSIKVFEAICTKTNNFKLKLIIIGPTPDKKYLEKCKKLVKNLNVEFTGFISDQIKEEILLNSKYGLHLFNNEHFGMAPCEMQNNNLLVFVYKNGGVIEFINNYDQQFINYKELIVKISNVLNSKEKRFASFQLMLKNKKKIFDHNFYTNLDELLSK